MRASDGIDVRIIPCLILRYSKHPMPDSPMPKSSDALIDPAIEGHVEQQ
jgi:hypothetical protein